MFTDRLRYAIQTHPVKIVVGLMIVSIMFIAIGTFFQKTIQTRLAKTIFTTPEGVYDYWSVLHFVLFALFGFVIPNHHGTFLAIGVSWEIVEDLFSSNEGTQLVDCRQKRKTLLTRLLCRNTNTTYWYMNYTDIFSNLFGYVLGSSIRTSLVSW